MAGDAKCTGRADQADVGQTFQPDVRLESLTYSMHSSAVPMRAEACPRRKLPRWLVCFLVLGFYLTLRGYHSFDGDQAYRLPLLLHRQNPQLYADDPFVQAFDGFNPHRGALMVLDVVTRPLGLPAGLFVLFVLTFGATCLGVERLARAAWPDVGDHVGLLAVGLVLAAKAGNIGTNHLFEAMLLDRLIAFALGWLALAQVVTDPLRHRWRAPGAICLATLIHPSVGLQLAMLLCGCWLAWSLLGRWTGIPFRAAILGMAGLVAAVVPGLAVNFDTGSSLVSNMPADVFWLLSVELQSPQHMLPHLWRMPQWLAWSSYLALAGLACASGIWSRRAGGEQESNDAYPPLPWPPARARLIVVLAVILAGLGVAWFFIEIRHHVRMTVFQPFRMATVARGIALVLVAGRLITLWHRGTWHGRLRAILMAVGFIGDWLLVVVTLSEVVVSIFEAIRSRIPWFTSWNFVDGGVWLLMLALGLNFLGHHDTEYGHIPLLAALGAGSLVGILENLRQEWGDETSVLKRTFGSFQVQRLGCEVARPPHPPFGHPLPVGARGEEAADAPVFPVPLASAETGVRGKERPILRLGGAIALAWFVPLAALVAAAIPWNHPWSRHALVTGLLNRCRFIEVPVDDLERLALWCQENMPASARFIGPPGPKTFRLWSLRNLAFNRAASPYHAAGLADWYARFQDHVDFHVAPAEFVRAYVRDRHRFEARYQAQSDAERAALAVRQGASYVVAAAPAAEELAGNYFPESRLSLRERSSFRGAKGDTYFRPAPECTGQRNCAGVGQPFQADVRLESLTYDTQNSAVPLRAHDKDHAHRLEPAIGVADLGPLELLHVEGRYAVYRVKLDTLVQRQR